MVECGCASTLVYCPCAFASSMTAVEINLIDHPIYARPYATIHGLNGRVTSDDFANENYSVRSRNYTANTFSSLGSALWGDHRQNAGFNGLNSLVAENWLRMMPSNLTASRFSNFVIPTPQACPIGLNSCRVSVPEGGSEATYLLMAALSCFAAMLFRRRTQTVAASCLPL